jgi:hypothetical protein
MIALEVIGGVILFTLAVATTWMAIVGLLGAVGAVRLRRCRSCGHLLASAPLRTSGVCLYCRHPWLVRHVMPVHLRHLLPEEMAPAGPPPSPGMPKAAAH